MRPGPLALLWLGILSLASSAHADLTVQQVIELSEQGLGKDDLVARVREQSLAFDLSPQDIIRMREAGVDPDVIVAMIEHEPPKRTPTPAAPVEPRPRPDEEGRAAPVVPPRAAAPRATAPAAPVAESLRIENRSAAPIFITRAAGKLTISGTGGTLRLSANHYYLLPSDVGSSSLVLEASAESRTIRVLARTHTRILYYGPRTYLIAEGLPLDTTDRVIQGLSPGQSLRGLTSTGYADRILVATDEGVEEYRGEWMAVSSRARAEKRHDPAPERTRAPRPATVDWPEDWQPDFAPPDAHEVPYHVPAPDYYPPTVQPWWYRGHAGGCR